MSTGKIKLKRESLTIWQRLYEHTCMTEGNVLKIIVVVVMSMYTDQYRGDQ